MTYALGIDGGGSTVRVSIVTPDLSVRAEYIGPAVNPRVVGMDEASGRIQAAIRAVLQQADLTADQISSVGIGIAGAANRYDWSDAWLRQTVTAVLPDTKVIPSSDYEIALVGALGQRLGILLLAGTGSLAYGVNAAGDSVLIGGWGYLIGDEGGGYWLGSQGLRALVRVADGRGWDTILYHRLLDALDLKQPLDVIDWLYGKEGPRVREVATLAPIVLECAAEGDAVATGIVSNSAHELALAVRTVRHRLDLQDQQPAFVGSLLTSSNALSKNVCDLLGLATIPSSKYPPVIGAALLGLQSI